MSRKLIQYASLQAVFLHMDPNLRILLALRLPAIRSAEKSVPIKLASLFFDPRGFKIDETFYKLGIVHAPGEVKLGVHNNYQINSETERRRQVLEYQIKWLEKELAEAQERFAQGEEIVETRDIPVNDWEGATIPAPELELQQQPEDEDDDLEIPRGPLNRPLRSLKVIQHNLNIAKDLYNPFLRRQNNTASPYTMFLQLKITSPDKETIYRMPYKMRLCEASRKLNAILFGRQKIYAKRLVYPFRCKVLLLPPGIQIRIRRLIIREDVSAYIKPLEKIIDPSSYPLDALTIDVGRFHPLDFDLPMLQQADKLYLLNEFKGNWLGTVRNLQNRLVRFNIVQFTIEEWIQLIRYWLENGKKVGTTYIFDVKRDATARIMLGRVAQEIEGTISENRYVMPMNENRVLKLYYRKLNSPSECGVEFNVYLEVRQAGM